MTIKEEIQLLERQALYAAQIREEMLRDLNSSPFSLPPDAEVTGLDVTIHCGHCGHPIISMPVKTPIGPVHMKCAEGK
jgi:hypothetical protein